MKYTSAVNSVALSFGVLLLAYAVLVHLGVSAGHFGDWVVAVLSGAWLLTVVVVPWDVYFRARAVLADAGPGRERGLAVDERQVAYVRRVARGGLALALGLHVLTAATLLAVAIAGVSKVGYAGCVVALLLTAVRPAAAAYRYLADRLSAIDRQWKYPAQDVVELRRRVDAAEAAVKRFDAEFDANRPESLLSRQAAQSAQARQATADVAAAVAAVAAANAVDHDRLAREARSAVAQVSADGQFLDHVREIIRFWKSA